jgi:hypothetical protein
MPEVIQDNLPPIKVAFIIDNEVVEVLHTDERLAAIFLSNPKIMDVSNKFTDENSVFINATYDQESNTFTNPDGTNV